MKDSLIELLETFGYPVRLQGSFAATEAYPTSFFTIWNNDSYDMNHYDGQPVAWTWSFSVNFYSIDPALVNTKLLEAIELLKENGWKISGKGYDVASDEKTHTGRGVEALFREEN